MNAACLPISLCAARRAGKNCNKAHKRIAGASNALLKGVRMADKGFVEQVEGKVKEAIGNMTGDTGEKAEGMLEQAVGKAKEMAVDAKDAAEEIGQKVGEKIQDALDK